MFGSCSRILLSPPARPWEAHRSTVPRTPQNPTFLLTKPPQHPPNALANAPPNHPKPTGVKQPDTPQSLTECQRPPHHLRQNHRKTTAKRLNPEQEWDPLGQRAPRGGRAASQHIRQLPRASSCPHGPTTSRIHGSWPIALGIVPEPATLASPVPSNGMSFRTHNLLLLVVLASLCVHGKGLQGLPFPSCRSKVGVQGSQLTRSN